MAEQRVTGDVLEHWASEAKKEPPGKLGSINLPAVVEMLIAEVRASRAREAELAAELQHVLDTLRQKRTEIVDITDERDNAAAQLAATEDQLARYKAAAAEAQQVMEGAIVRGGYRPGEEQRVAALLGIPVED